MDAEYRRALEWAANELSVPGPSDAETPEETNQRLRRVARRRQNKRVVRFLRTELSEYLDRLHP